MKALSIGSSSANSTPKTAGHNNPFAVRPSTGIKKKVVLQQKPKLEVKTEPEIDDEDQSALSQMIEDDDFDEPMEIKEEENDEIQPSQVSCEIFRILQIKIPKKL